MGLQSNTKRVIASGIERLRPFTRGNVRGIVGSDGTGRLPDDLAIIYRWEAARGEVEYTIYSYATPIAWKVTGMTNWVFPGESYSRSTTQHQAAVREAMGA